MATSQSSIILAFAFLWNSRPMTDQPTGKSGSQKARVCVFHIRHASSCLPAEWSRCAAQALVTAAYLSLAHGLGPNSSFGEEATGMCKRLWVKQSDRGVVGERCRSPRRTLASQSIGGRQGKRDSVPHSSAGANMCSRYNLRCNQNVMGERPGSATAASNPETREEERRDRRRRRVTQRGVKAILWKLRIFFFFLGPFDWRPNAALIWSNSTQRAKWNQKILDYQSGHINTMVQDCSQTFSKTICDTENGTIWK